MQKDPKKDRTQLDYILLEQFRRKGYKCEEIEEENATLFIITHGRKTTDILTHLSNGNYKDFFKAS